LKAVCSCYVGLGEEADGLAGDVGVCDCEALEHVW
jgi:hypothetical protein